MRVLALLILPSLAFADPPANQAEKSGIELPLPAVVELKLSSTDRNVVEITIQNNGQEPLELPYRVTPFEHLVVELQGENGKQHKIEHTSPKVDEKGEKQLDKKLAGDQSGTLSVPAGKSKTLSLHACHFYPLLGDLEQKVTFIARLKHDGKLIESKPLIVDP